MSAKRHFCHIHIILLWEWVFCLRRIPRFISSLWCIFVIIVKENKTSINNAASHFQLFLTLFQNKEIKCIRIPLVSQNNNKKSLWSRHCHFHLTARHWCEDWEGFVKFADREMWCEECREIPLHLILLPRPVAGSGYYVLLLRSWGGNADGIWNDVEKPSWRLEWWVHTHMGTTQPISPSFMKMQCVGSLQNAIWLIFSNDINITLIISSIFYIASNMIQIFALSGFASCCPWHHHIALLSRPHPLNICMTRTQFN